MTTHASTSFSWFLLQVRAGIRYALYFMVIGFIMGMIYGLFGGVYIVPGLFAVALIGIFCVMNFVVALLAAIVNLILALIKKSNRRVFRYFGLSLGFVVVFLLFFYAIHIFQIEVF